MCHRLGDLCYVSYWTHFEFQAFDWYRSLQPFCSRSCRILLVLSFMRLFEPKRFWLIMLRFLEVVQFTPCFRQLFPSKFVYFQGIISLFALGVSSEQLHYVTKAYKIHFGSEDFVELSLHYLELLHLQILGVLLSPCSGFCAANFSLQS